MVSDGRITLRYWASARAAAGVPTDVVDVVASTTLADLFAESLRRHADADRLPAILKSCSVLVGDRPTSTRPWSEVVVAPGQVVEFLPPFAGG